MKVIKVVLLLIILVVLFVGLSVVQVSLDARGLTNPNLYATALGRSGFFEALPEAVIEIFRQGASGVPAEEQAKIEAALREAAEPAWVAEQLSPAIMDICRYVRGEVSSLSADIRVGDILDRFLQAYAKTGDPEVVADFRKIVGNQVPEVVRLSDASQSDALGGVIGGYRTIAVAGIIAGVACFLLVLLCFPLASGLPGGLRWAGAAFLASGLAGVVASVVVNLTAPGLVMNLNLAGGPTGAAQMGRDLAWALIGGVAGVIRTQGLVSAGIGVACLVGAAFAGAARSRKRPAAAAGPAATPGQPEPRDRPASRALPGIARG